jgi:hypothetical protein
MVQLIMQISRGEDDRLTGTVRRGSDADGLRFSGTLELMRVFEELVPADQEGTEASSASRSGRLAAPELRPPHPTKTHSSGEG